MAEKDPPVGRFDIFQTRPSLLMSYDESDEVQIEIYETVSGQYSKTTAAISIVGNGAFAPTLRIDVEAGKFKDFP